jgi:hypothetical protein
MVLRDIVIDAADTRNVKSLLQNAPPHPAVDLVRKYLDSRDETFIDRAAAIVAMEKPGVERAMAERHPWLVLDKL